MDKNNNGYDAFADDEVGGLGKYSDRNLATVRLEQAHALEKRINEFSSRKHDLTWATEAETFAAALESEAKDLSDISNAKSRLSAIRGEARALIEAEERRIAAEKEAEKKSISDTAERVDRLISSLDSSPRSRYWCEEVKNAEREVELMARESRLLMKNLPTLDRLKDESELVLRALKLDSQARELLGEGVHDEDWADRAEELLSDIPVHVLKYMSDSTVIGRIKEAISTARRAAETSRREAEIADKASEYEDLIKEVSSIAEAVTTISKKDHIESLEARYRRLDGELASLDFDVTKTIERFDARWKETRRLLEKKRSELDYEIERIEEMRRRERLAKEEQERAIEKLVREMREDDERRARMEAERLRKEEEERAEAERIRQREEIERAERERKAKLARVRRVGLISAAIAGGAAILLFILGLVIPSSSGWLIGSAISLAVTVFFGITLPTLTVRIAPTWVVALINSLMAAAAIAFLFIDPRYSVCLALVPACALLGVLKDKLIERLDWLAHIPDGREKNGYYGCRLVCFGIGVVLLAISVGICFFGDSAVNAVLVGLAIATGIIYLIVLIINVYCLDGDTGILFLISVVASLLGLLLFLIFDQNWRGLLITAVGVVPVLIIGLIDKILDWFG